VEQIDFTDFEFDVSERPIDIGRGLATCADKVVDYFHEKLFLGR